MKKGARRSAHRMSEVSGAANGAATGRRGMVAGTRVATAMGWRNVEAIQPGDLVLTFDRGLQEVVDVSRALLVDSGRERDWPYMVPAGALGNTEEVMLAPRQDIVIESDLAEMLHGDPFAVVPAFELSGVRGITPVFPGEGFEIVTLHFRQEEVVFGAMGALFHCPDGGDLLGTPTSKMSYPRLSSAQARGVVADLPQFATETPLPVAAVA